MERILATSDLHGKFMPWDYSMNEESTKGSAAQLSSAIADHRTDETLLVDAGDLGGIRELIRDYIVHAENGVLTPECSHNWRIVIP